jgi:hypothetical protein
MKKRLVVLALAATCAMAEEAGAGWKRPGAEPEAKAAGTIGTALPGSEVSVTYQYLGLDDQFGDSIDASGLLVVAGRGRVGRDTTFGASLPIAFVVPERGDNESLMGNPSLSAEQVVYRGDGMVTTLALTVMAPTLRTFESGEEFAACMLGTAATHYSIGSFAPQTLTVRPDVRIHRSMDAVEIAFESGVDLWLPVSPGELFDDGAGGMLSSFEREDETDWFFHAGILALFLPRGPVSPYGQLTMVYALTNDSDDEDRVYGFGGGLRFLPDRYFVADVSIEAPYGADFEDAVDYFVTARAAATF